MTLDRKRVYAAAVLYPGALLLVLFASDITVKNWLLTVLTVGFGSGAYFLIPKRTAKDLPHREVTLVMGFMAALVLMLYYLTGLSYGFYKNPIPGHFIYRYTIPIAVTVLSSELLRSIFLQQRSKWVTVLSYIAMVLLECLLLSKLNVFDSFTKFRDFTAMILFPALAGNLLYHYLSKRFGMLPNILYRLPMTLYVYILGYTPKTPDAFVAFFKLLLPLIIFFFIRMLYQKRHFAAHQKKSIFSTILGIIVVILMALTIMLISCQFRYGLLVVGSESMTGTVDKGDCVIYEEYTGQVIPNEVIAVFKSGGTTYIHRVVDIESIDGELRYYTKGDANEGIDAGFVTNGDIIGIVTHKIKYIGLPTIWIRDLFK